MKAHSIQRLCRLIGESPSPSQVLVLVNEYLSHLPLLARANLPEGCPFRLVRDVGDLNDLAYQMRAAKPAAAGDFGIVQMQVAAVLAAAASRVSVLSALQGGERRRDAKLGR